jgi:hypothetical protein
MNIAHEQAHQGLIKYTMYKDVTTMVRAIVDTKTLAANTETCVLTSRCN